MQPKKRIIEVVPYDPRWPETFRRESARISMVLKEQIVKIHHIGSTSVPGLKAKPIIDILLAVKDVGALDAFDAEMKALGYTPRGEYGIPGRRFYLKGLHNRTHHIHAFNAGSAGAQRHLAFRDYLIAHPDIAKKYEILKVRCAEECHNNIDRYCEGKHDFVQAHEKKALEWKKRQL